ncbi:MAG: DUF3179 domain-containing protein, partial [Boseongicola sp.]
MLVRLIAVFAVALLPLLASAADVPASWKRAWPQTDFSRISVDPSEVFSGGPPKDGIPAITGPEMIAASAESALDPREPVMVLELDGQPARAYPVRYLMWHEIVNDVAGDVPIAVTFCPLCNSGLIFDRRLDGQVLEFGVSGKLRNSDMVMFDRQTDSWWQQFTGEGIVGVMTGKQLTPVVSWMESLGEFRERNPDGEVMAEPANYNRQYGANPYAGYDQSARPFLYRGENPPFGIEPLSRVIRVGSRAWPLERLQDLEEITEAGVRIVWQSGMASALDARRIADARNIGSIRVFDAASGEDVL